MQNAERGGVGAAVQSGNNLCNKIQPQWRGDYTEQARLKAPQLNLARGSKNKPV